MKYIPIRINTLRPDDSVSFDVFIKVGDGYVHYIRDTDPFDQERLTRIKKKGVKKLYIPEESESRYLEYLDAGLNLLTASGRPVEERGAIAHDSLVTSAENVERNLDSEQGIQQINRGFSKVIDFLVSDRTAIKSILNTAGCSADYFQHAATVSSLSLSMATKLGEANSKDLLDLGVAALVHDIGKTRLNLPSMKPVDQLTPNERKLYESHVSEGIAMLSGKKMITPRILGLVASHEEIGNGQGYPEKKVFSKLAKHYQILNLCNDFDRFSYERNIPHEKAIDPFFEARGSFFDDELISILATVLT